MYYPARSKIKYAKPDLTKMCGDGRIEELEHGPASPNLRAAHVRFVNGARTKWHYHTEEQILLAIEGTGFVELQGIPKIELHPGDRVFVPTGTWHRHGALEKKTLVHLAVTKGETEWDSHDPCDMELETKTVPEKPDYLAPDGSEIRLLPTMNGGGLAHCTLPPGGVSKPVYHRTVEEIWYCIEGNGEVWRKQDDREEATSFSPGVSLTIPTGTHFQFRNTGDEPLRFIIATTPPWPGASEAVELDNGHWDGWGEE